MNPHHTVEDIPRLNAWIQTFRERNVPVDIDRITRFAIFRGRDKLARHLVETEHAKLKQKDKLGRSAIFYAAGRNDPAMLKYINSELDATTFQEELSRPDVNNRTPWYYAVMFESSANVTFCLATGARPDDATVALASSSDSGKPDQRTQIRLLFTLYNQLNAYLTFPVYAESISKSELSDVQHMTALKSAERDLTWIHIPWTNVS